MIKIEFHINKSNESHILNHLLLCDSNFTPPLSSRTNLKEYAKKLGAKSERFEVWINHVLIGLVAVYQNELNNSIFISNVSVDPNFKGQGFAKKLIREVVKYAEKLKFNVIELEVNKTNFAAIKLYTSLNFKQKEEINNNLILELKIL